MTYRLSTNRTIPDLGSPVQPRFAIKTGGNSTVIEGLCMPVELDWDTITPPIAQAEQSILAARPQAQQAPNQVRPVAYLTMKHGGTQINASVLKKNGLAHVYLGTNAKMDAYTSKFTAMFGQEAKSFGHLAAQHLKDSFSTLKSMPFGTLNCYNLSGSRDSMSYLYSVRKGGEIFFQQPTTQAIVEPEARPSLCSGWHKSDWNASSHWPTLSREQHEEAVTAELANVLEANSVLILFTVDGSAVPTVHNTLCVRMVGPNYRAVHRAINNNPDIVKRLFTLSMFWYGGEPAIAHYEATHPVNRGIERPDVELTPERAIYYIGVLGWHMPHLYQVFVYYIECLIEMQVGSVSDLSQRDEAFDDLFRHDPSRDIREKAAQMIRDARDYVPQEPLSPQLTAAIHEFYAEATSALWNEWCPLMPQPPAGEVAQPTMGRYVAQNTMVKEGDD